MQDIKEIILKSTYKIEDGVFIYAKVSSPPADGEHFFVAKDSDEITVVTEEKNLAELELIEQNKEKYKLIALNVSVPFYAVGFLATVTSAIAKEGMNVLVVSTFSKDYILVKQENIAKAELALINLGFKQPPKKSAGRTKLTNRFLICHFCTSQYGSGKLRKKKPSKE